MEQEDLTQVNNPPHYQGQDGAEAIDIIELMDRNFNPPFHLTHALKYMLRFREKGGKESLRKAIWYIERAIKYEYGSEYAGEENLIPQDNPQ